MKSGNSQSPVDIPDSSLSSEINEINDSTSDTVRPIDGLSDNMANPPDKDRVSNDPPNSGSNDTPSPPIDPLNLTKEALSQNLLLVLNELRDIKQQMLKLDRIELTTATLVEQLGGNIKKTAELEKVTYRNKEKLKEFGNDLMAVKTNVNKQEKSLSNFKAMREEVAKSSAETIADLNSLIDTQRQQVDSFNSSTRQLKKDILIEVERKLEKRD